MNLWKLFKIITKKFLVELIRNNIPMLTKLSILLNLLKFVIVSSLFWVSLAQYKKPNTKLDKRLRMTLKALNLSF